MVALQLLTYLLTYLLAYLLNYLENIYPVQNFIAMLENIRNAITRLPMDRL